MRFFNGLPGFCAALALSAPLCAEAWTLKFDPPARILAEEVAVDLNPANCPAGIEGVLEKALAVWDNAHTSYLRVRRGSNTNTTPGQVVARTQPGFAVVCDPSYGASTGGDPNSTHAATYVSVQGPAVVSGGVVINTQTAIYTALSADAQSQILAHELGHVLGLGHSSDPNALMYYYNRSPLGSLALAEDDLDGLSYLYGRNDFKDGQYLGCGSIEALKPGGGDDSGAPGGALALVAYFLILWLASLALKRKPAPEI